MTERLYYNDSFLTNFGATVTEVQELSRENGQSLWRLALDCSAFYPTGGGQPHDTGKLIATSRGGAELMAEIVGVEEDEAGQVWHHTAKPIQAGTQVRGEVNIVRRIDHMQQHTGQHLLSAAFLRVCNAPTVSFHLGENVSTVDLAVEKLPEAAIREAEELSNRIIAEDRPVAVGTATHEQAEAWLASGKLRKLPSRQGDFRIIEIADFDLNACGGTHVRATGQIGGLHVRGTEKVRQGIRVEFVCGLRTMRAAREDYQTLTGAARRLAISLTDVPEAIERLQAQAKAAAKENERLTAELIEFRAVELARELAAQAGMRFIRRQLAPPEFGSVAAAKLFGSRLVAVSPQAAAIFSWRSAKDVSATVIFARSGDLNFDCGSLLRATLAENGGRGGGSGDMAQGTVAADRVDAALDALEAAIPR